MESPKIEYVPMANEEKDKLLAFYSEMLPDGEILSTYYQWRINGLPHSSGTKPYVAKVGQDIVGTINIVPVRLYYKGKKIKASWQQDSIVFPAMRGLGVGKKIADAAAKEWEIVMAKGTNQAMYCLRKSIGFLDVPNSNFLIRGLSPFCSNNDLRDLFISFVLYITGKLKGALKVKTDLTFHQIFTFDDKFDALAESLAKSNEIRPYKGKDYLNWRYFECPGRKYTVTSAHDFNNLRGAVVLRDNKFPGDTAYIVDFLCDSNDAECINGLLNETFNHFKTTKANRVTTFATSDNLRTVLFKRGFINTKNTPRFTFRVEQKDLFPIFKNARWNFCHGDGDIELYE